MNPSGKEKWNLQDCCSVEVQLLWNGSACKYFCMLLDVPWLQWRGRREGERTGKVDFVSSVVYCLCQSWPWQEEKESASLKTFFLTLYGMKWQEPYVCECLSWEQHTIKTVLLKHWAGVLGMFPNVVDARSVQSLTCRGLVSLPCSTDDLEIMHVVNWLFLFVSAQIQYLAFVSIPNSKWDHWTVSDQYICLEWAGEL